MLTKNVKVDYAALHEMWPSQKAILDTKSQNAIVGKICQQQMLATNVSNKCQQQMSATNVSNKCQQHKIVGKIRHKGPTK